MKKYIHYGAKEFCPELVKGIVNKNMFTKPRGGLWASAIDAKYSWKDWNEENDVRDCDEDYSFLFTLSDKARVLTINSVLDLEALPQIPNPLFELTDMVYLDFEELSKTYDAIEVNISSDWGLYDALYSWDCDSILIMNKDIVNII